MAQLRINLASEPFRRDRPVLVAGAAMAVALTGLLTLLILLVLGERDHSRDARETLASLETQTAKVTQERARLEAVLRRPENAEVFDRSVFLNALLSRKGISWTRLFADLESVMPHNVRLVSIRPQVTSQNQVVLDMVVAAQATEPVIQFTMKLEGSPVFGSVAVANSLPPSQTDPLYRYRITVNYAQKL
ncbi:MAG: hypothetical protein FJW40_08545 [Acidobacteria bacterium]|nr:hypothetical protein [Acidobacteriota bacterium]